METVEKKKPTEMIKALEEQKRNLKAKMTSILDKAEEEKRNLSADERKEWRTFEDQIKEVDENLEIWESQKRSYLEKAAEEAEDLNKKQSSSKYSTRKYGSIEIIDRASIEKKKEDKSEVRFGSWLRLMGTGNPRSHAEESVLEERAVSTLTDAAGGYISPEFLSDQLQQALINNSVIFQSGAQLIPLDQLNGDTFKYAKVDTLPTISWYTPTGGDAIADSDPVFGVNTFNPKSAKAKFSANSEFLQDAIDGDIKLEQIALQAAAQAIETAALTGTGASNQPTGLFNTSGLNSVVFGSGNGAAPTSFDELVDSKYEILNAKGDVSNLSVIHHPRTARDYAKLKDAQNQPLQMPKFLDNISFYESQSISITETAGTGTDLSESIMGNMRNLLVGMRLRPSVFVDPYSLSANDQVLYRITFRLDVAVSNPEHFTLLSAIASA